MIDYLTHPKFVDYDCAQLPSAQSGGGGMGVKTSRVLEALRSVYPNTRAITDGFQIESDTVLIEPLRFSLATAQYSAKPHQTADELLEFLVNSDAKKILYCSELTLMRMPHSIREQVLACCDAVTTNCAFQANVFKYVGVRGTHKLCDPVPDVFLPRLSCRDRKPRVVATGNVSWEKNAPQVIEVFKALKGVVERVYVGSASLWHDASNEEIPQRLQEVLYGHTDRVVKEATTQQIANEFHNARFGLWVAYHDTFATATQEMIMAGLPVVAAKHGLVSEIPVWAASGVRGQVETIKRLLGESNESLEEQSKRISTWAAENMSYAAFQKQVASILKAVW